MAFYLLYDEAKKVVPGERRWLEPGVKTGPGAVGEYARMDLDPDQRDMTMEAIDGFYKAGHITKERRDAEVAKRK